MKYTYSLLIACFVIIISGCSGSGTNSTPSPALTAPKVGSTFTYQNVNRDTNNVVISTDTSVQRILQTNYSIGGKTDVLLQEETNADGTKDTNYVRFTSDGDVQLFSKALTASFLPEWLPIPLTTHKTQVFTGDTVIVNLNFSEFDTTVFTLKYERTENVTVKGAAISSSVVSLTITSTARLTNGTTTIRSSSTQASEISFGSLVSWLTRQKDILSVSNDKHQPMSESTLIDYTLAK